MAARPRGDMETSFSVRSFDANMTREEYDRLPKNPLYIILDNLRSAFNVGSIFRTCDILRVSGLFLCGYTAFPPHIKLQKTSLGTIDFVPWRHFEKTVAALEFLQEQSIPVWAAETTSHAVAYHCTPYPSPVGIVLGNEALGVSREVLGRCDRVVQIPTYGYKNSLNVAAACAVIGYKVLESFGKQIKKRP